MKAEKSSRLANARQLHDAAVDAYVRAVEPMDDAAWRALLRGGKWTPADVTQHLILTFAVLTRELGGGPGMQIRVPFLKRLVIRATIVRKLLRDGVFPRGAPAPREVRPDPADTTGRTEAIGRFREAAMAFAEQTLREAAAGRVRSLTHPYFGAMSLPDTLLMSARHVEHHTRQVLGEF